MVRRGKDAHPWSAGRGEMAEERLLDLLLPPARTGRLRPRPTRAGRCRKRGRSLRAGALRDGSRWTTGPSKSRSRSERCRWSDLMGGHGMGGDAGIISRRCWETSCRSAPAAARSRCTRPAASLTQEEGGQSWWTRKEVTSSEAVSPRVENSGIVFLDEVEQDRRTGKGSAGPRTCPRRRGPTGPACPIVGRLHGEHGKLRPRGGRTHILFIRGGRLHVAKPSDLIPELQGRFPLRVELTSLTQRDFVRISDGSRKTRLDQAVQPLSSPTEGRGSLAFTAGCGRRDCPGSPRRSTRRPRIIGRSPTVHDHGALAGRGLLRGPTTWQGCGSRFAADQVRKQLDEHCPPIRT